MSIYIKNKLLLEAAHVPLLCTLTFALVASTVLGCDMQSNIFTIGYEQATVPGILAALSQAGIDVLADVRALAMSRRRGFAKTALRAALSGIGIEYQHFPLLGNPKPGREAAWRGDLQWKSIFRSHLATKSAQDALMVLVDLARVRRTCLLCLEDDVETCHRKIVADAAATFAGFSVTHLSIRTTAAKTQTSGYLSASVA
jgi:uncharacterized protein (DUF488 family)